MTNSTQQITDATISPSRAVAFAGAISPRFVLRLDAAVSGANGVAYLVAAGPLGELLGLSPELLRVLGGVLIAFAAAAWLGASRGAGRAVLLAFAGANAAWATASIVVAIAGWGSPSVAGTVWIVAQALVVAAFAELQAISARR